MAQSKAHQRNKVFVRNIVDSCDDVTGKDCPTNGVGMRLCRLTRAWHAACPLVLALLLLAAQPVHGADKKSGDSISLSIWAVAASKTEKSKPSPLQTGLVDTKRSKKSYFDKGLEEIRPAVADLPFNTYKKVKTGKESLAIGKETRFAVDDKYTLILKPVGKEPGGKVRIGLTVEMAPKKKGGKPVKALDTRLVMRPEQMLKIRGLKRQKDELVLVLRRD